MTKVQMRFRVQKPVDEDMFTRLAEAPALYGIRKVKLDRPAGLLLVEYDATRLRPAEVAAALAGAGIPVEPA
jgi:hypothetical protein